MKDVKSESENEKPQKMLNQHSRSQRSNQGRFCDNSFHRPQAAAATRERRRASVKLFTLQSAKPPSPTIAQSRFGWQHPLSQLRTTAQTIDPPLPPALSTIDRIEAASTMAPTPPSTGSSMGGPSPPDYRVVRKRNRVPLSCAPCRHKK